MALPEERIERAYCVEDRRMAYVALEELNFVWDVRTVSEFERLWTSGISLVDIAHILNRDCDEVVILAMDRGRKGRIKPRKGGVLGIQESCHS